MDSDIRRGKSPHQVLAESQSTGATLDTGCAAAPLVDNIGVTDPRWNCKFSIIIITISITIIITIRIVFSSRSISTELELL
mmetsp:Transcript_85327/g.156288  ORF Transcript_85327/g.156288 Transcript_85327/m.156288 type:complete len:81 (-) Transcript_85327:148-390(-)